MTAGEYLNWEGEGEPPLRWFIARALAPFIFRQWGFERYPQEFDMTNNSGRDLCDLAACAVLDVIEVREQGTPLARERASEHIAGDDITLPNNPKPNPGGGG